jgi:electron transfer flavoprotein alpha subunit
MLVMSSVRTYIQLSRLAPVSARLQSTLVLADHHDGKLNESTLHAFSAAKAVGGNDLACLVAGDGVGEVAKAVASVDGLKKVIVADSPDLKGVAGLELMYLATS